MNNDLISIELADTLDVDISGTLIKGDDGFSPIIDITQLENGVKITATDIDKTSVGEVTVSKENVIGALGYTPGDEAVLPTKVDKVDGKGLSTNDFTDTLKTKLDNIEDGAQVNIQSDWEETNNESDAYILNKPSIYTSTEIDKFLSEKANNATTLHGYGITDAHTIDETSTLLDKKVDKVSGKALSSNDFTSAFKTKLESIESNANVNVQSDWNISDNSSDAYIKNKPDIYLKTDTNTLLDAKVDRVVGKSLIDDSEISRLANVKNYDDSNIKNDITTITSDIENINDQINQLSKITLQLNADGDIEAVIQV